VGSPFGAGTGAYATISGALKVERGCIEQGCLVYHYATLR
jgi:hypothetical protein